MHFRKSYAESFSGNINCNVKFTRTSKNTTKRRKPVALHEVVNDECSPVRTAFH